MIDPEMMEDDEPEETPQLSPFKMYMNEHGRVVKAVVATFFITSLLWAFVLLMVFNKAVGDKTPRDKAVEVAGQVTASQQQKALAPRYEATAKKDVDYSQVIVGHWEPVDVTAYKLDFSEYGTLKTETRRHGYTERGEYKFKLLGDQLGYTIMADFYEGDWHRIEVVTGEDGLSYLTIFEDPVLGGRYKKTK